MSKKYIWVSEEEFFKFLKKHGVEKEFKSNVHQPLKDLSKIYPKRWVSVPIYWSGMPSGVTFWQQINEKWKNYLRKPWLKRKFL